MEKLISERRSTISYRDNSVFRKYYKFANKKDVLAEIDYSIKIYNEGINCPRCLGYGYSDDKKMFYSEYEYRMIQSIDKDTVSEDVVKRALEIINFMPLACGEIHNGFKNILENDVFFILEYLPQQNKSKLFEILSSIIDNNKDIIIHGDYTFENIGWDIANNDLIIYDFQNACVGIKDWDKAYLISSLINETYYSFLAEEKFDLVRLISAIRYGRGIRKNFEVEERRKIYEYWWE